MIIWNYIEISEETGKSAIIWNYIETLIVYKSICSLLKFGCICNYISDKNDKTI